MKRRPVRLVAMAVAAYVAVALAVTLLTMGAVVLARLVTDAPVTEPLAGVGNFRRVDHRLWAGGQPDAGGYRELARRGVSVVVDLRTGASDDPTEDDPSLLSALGIEYRRLPVPDGHAPGREHVRRFLGVVERATGVVFVHCGAGVGRTNAVQAAYLASTGKDPSLSRLVAVGPMTLEQAWVVAAARAGDPGSPNPVVRRLSEVLDAPRRGLSRLRGWL